MLEDTSSLTETEKEKLIAKVESVWRNIKRMIKSNLMSYSSLEETCWLVYYQGMQTGCSFFVCADKKAPELKITKILGWRNVLEEIRPHEIEAQKGEEGWRETVFRQTKLLSRFISPFESNDNSNNNADFEEKKTNFDELYKMIISDDQKEK